MSRNIAYIGFGALGKQVAALIRQTGRRPASEIFFDDQAVNQKLSGSHFFNHYTEEQFADYEFLICLGYKHLARRKEIADQLKQLGRKLGQFIHPSAFVNPDAQIEPGTIIYPGCNVDQQVILQEGVFLNNSVTVSHDTVIGRHSFLAPGVTVCGNTRIGEQCFVGAGAVIVNGVQVGDRAIIGAGSLITGDIPPGASVIGNPMRLLDKKIELQ